MPLEERPQKEVQLFSRQEEGHENLIGLFNAGKSLLCPVKQPGHIKASGDGLQIRDAL